MTATYPHEGGGLEDDDGEGGGLEGEGGGLEGDGGGLEDDEQHFSDRTSLS